MKARARDEAGVKVQVPELTRCEWLALIDAARARCGFYVASKVNKATLRRAISKLKRGQKVIVNPLHWYFREAHLEHVIEKMKVLGQPRLRGFFDGEIWHMREGTHRLRAALALGVVPILIPVRWDRSPTALVRARFAAIRNGHTFDSVVVDQ